MNKLTKYIALSAAAMAVAGCSGAEPVLPDDNLEISENGTLVTDHLAFTTKITGRGQQWLTRKLLDNGMLKVTGEAA